MVLSSNLGFPRMGLRRELKKALEQFWQDKCSADHLLSTAQRLREVHWKLQQEAGLSHIPCNDFSLYDHVLDTAVMVGAVPERFGKGEVDLERYFTMARGGKGKAGPTALEMTKWFDTNYHYLVPEFSQGQEFTLSSLKSVKDFREALALGIKTRPVLLGPVSFLLLGKAKDSDADPLDLWPRLVPIYEEILRRLGVAGAEWVQIDEPCLVTDLDPQVILTLETVYRKLVDAAPGLKLLLATYFGPLGDALPAVLNLPVQAVHLDLVRGSGQLDGALEATPENLTLSLGLIDGRNVWRSDLGAALELAERAAAKLGPDRIIIAPSCSLLHVPIDLDDETTLDPEILDWLAFAKQKLVAVEVITRGLQSGRAAVAEALSESEAANRRRRTSSRTHNTEVRRRLAEVTPTMLARTSPHGVRHQIQRDKTPLPLLPTTTIGSFPQTEEVRKARAAFKARKLDAAAYDAFLRSQTEQAVRWQEEVGLDVLVHGEFERNDMVEYFGEQLDGFIFTTNGWVQSYGSRCVKPPIIYGDVGRQGPMTVAWSEYAQSLTSKPIKGMLTGPVTILQWSFVRDDQPRKDTCSQIALAIRDEVADLERAGIALIQIDEPALREGLPLRKAEWGEYLNWAVDAFRLAASGVRDDTQIHTHMCYCDFNDIIASIAALDADVISIETSRSQMELLGAFGEFQYPNEIGPGVYDIHSPRIPTQAEVEDLLHKALAVLPANHVWVNPDCGLKTRRWEEVKPALETLVKAARALRERLGVNAV